MNKWNVEFAVGLFLVAGIAALFFLALRVSGLATDSQEPTYKIYAHYQNIGGLTVRAKVTMAGVAIGRVSSIVLDPKTLTAKVTFDIYKSVNQISTDSVASILTAGLLGEKYIGIVPGADDTNLKDGDEIQQTQSALVLEDLIGKFLFNKATQDAGKSSGDSGQPAGSAGSAAFVQ